MPETPPELTLDQIMAHFATDEAAREYLEAVRWPDGPVCSHCGVTSERVTKLEGESHRAGLYQCNECQGQFTVTVGTIFADSHIPLRKWLVAWYMLCSSKKGISALQMQRMLDIGSYRSAWFMMHRIRYALRDPAFSDKLGGGGGTVEADETYVGGKVKGMGRAYKGNKTAVVALVERGGRVRSRSVGKVTGKTLRQFLDQHGDPSAHLMTDDLAGYRSMSVATLIPIRSKDIFLCSNAASSAHSITSARSTWINIWPNLIFATIIVPSATGRARLPRSRKHRASV
jgi:transposase-like protein